MKIAVALVCALLASAHGLKRTPQMDRIFKSDGPSSHIVGGAEANIADFPHMLAMLLNNNFRCGAGNIHPLWALSAARKWRIWHKTLINFSYLIIKFSQIVSTTTKIRPPFSLEAEAPAVLQAWRGQKNLFFT